MQQEFSNLLHEPLDLQQMREHPLTQPIFHIIQPRGRFQVTQAMNRTSRFLRFTEYL